MRGNPASDRIEADLKKMRKIATLLENSLTFHKHYKRRILL